MFFGIKRINKGQINTYKDKAGKICIIRYPWFDVKVNTNPNLELLKALQNTTNWIIDNYQNKNGRIFETWSRKKTSREWKWRRCVHCHIFTILLQASWLNSMLHWPKFIGIYLINTHSLNTSFVSFFFPSLHLFGITNFQQ